MSTRVIFADRNIGIRHLPRSRHSEPDPPLSDLAWSLKHASQEFEANPAPLFPGLACCHSFSVRTIQKMNVSMSKAHIGSQTGKSH